MTSVSTFKRHELKYLITRAQKADIINEISGFMELDSYGRSEIRSVYFDTPDYRLIRKSLEKPVYKEKLRLRSYGRVREGGDIFVELKKKYQSIVYKRRIRLNEPEALDWLADGGPQPESGQIANEIDYFIRFYPQLLPRAIIFYAREAYFMKDGSDFRVTFDDTILARKDDIDLKSEAYGSPLIPEELVLMELKISDAMPMGLARLLAREHICQSSFSKYGTFYEKYIFPEYYANGVKKHD